MPKAYASTVIDRPAREVWAVVRDFNGLPGWLPAVTRSAIEDGQPADRIGCVRSIHLADGANARAIHAASHMDSKNRSAWSSRMV